MATLFFSGRNGMQTGLMEYGMMEWMEKTAREVNRGKSLKIREKARASYHETPLK
jgi:hypothetical protein